MATRDESGNKKKDRKLVLEDKAVIKEMEKLPAGIRGQFLASLEMVRLGLPPALNQEKLHAAGNGVMELKINGKPAWRCMYVVRNGDVVVLHATSKTQQGQDQQLIKTTSLRLKRLAADR